MCAPVPSCVSARVRPSSSEIRSPVWTAVSSSAWSRRPAHVDRLGASSSACVSTGGKERDGAFLGALAWDREHALRQGGVLGVSQRAVVKEGVDRGEPDVAGAGGVPALLLEVLKKRADRRRVEVGDLQLRWRRPGCPVDVAKEESEGVAVAGDRVRADASLTDQPVGEVRLKRWCQAAHRESFPGGVAVVWPQARAGPARPSGSSRCWPA
jgi:hypothetical protein